MSEAELPVVENSETEQSGPLIAQGWLRALLIIPAWIVFLIAAGLAAVLVIGLEQAERIQAEIDSGAALFANTLQILAFLIPVFLFWKLIDRRSLADLGFRINRESVRDFFLGSFGGILLISIVFGIIYVFSGVEITGFEMPGRSFAMMTLMMFLVGLGEETAIRGYLLANCMASFNKYAALIVTSVVFAVAHLANPNQSVMGFVNIILAGALLGIYYVHKKNLWFPIGLHWTWNLFQGSFYGSEVSGVEIDSVLITNVTGSDLLTGGPFGFEASLVTTLVLLAATCVLHLILRPRPTGTA